MAFPWMALATFGGSLIGAKANQNAADKANAQQDPVYMRKRLEAAGLNPAVHYGSMASRQIAVAQPGSLIANGFAAAADILQTDKSLEIQRTRLEQENERLNREVTRLTLNPKVPGVYGNATTRRIQAGGGKAINLTSGGSNPPTRDDLDNASRNDKPFLPANLFSALTKVVPIGSQRMEAEPATETTQPLSWLGMTFRSTGTTSAAHKVEDNAGDLAGSFWAAPVLFDYAVGTYSHNIGRPFVHAMKALGRQAKGKSGATKKRREKVKSKEYQDFMKKHYPTPFD